MKVRNMVICALFASLMAVGANVSPMLMIGGVPVTLQLLFAILAGGLLGSRLGSMAMIIYICLGLVGAPVFAQFKGGITSILSPTFGFVISFIFVAYVVGFCLEKKTRTIFTYVYTGVFALLANYLIGSNLMYLAFKFWTQAPDGFSYKLVWIWMGAYLPLDIVVTLLSLLMIPKLSKALKRYTYI